MDEMIGYAVVGIIIACLIYALIKQIKETKHSGNCIGSPCIENNWQEKIK